MEKKIEMSVQYDCTGMMESEQQEFQVKFKEEEEFEGGMSSDFFMNYMRKGIEDLIKRFPSHYKAVNNCFKHYEEEKKLDTVNMANQMISFRGMEISMDDILNMYKDFENMMGRVNKKFLEDIIPIGGKEVIIDIDESHAQDYFGAMSFVKKLLEAKSVQPAMRLLFQAWLVNKDDFIKLFKSIISNTDMNETNVNICAILMPFGYSNSMYKYDKDSKKITRCSDDSALTEGIMKNVLKELDLFKFNFTKSDKVFNILDEFEDFDIDNFGATTKIEKVGQDLVKDINNIINKKEAK